MRLTAYALSMTQEGMIKALSQHQSLLYMGTKPGCKPIEVLSDRNDYFLRPASHCEVEEEAHALEQVFVAFQNLDTRQTPDHRQSMQMGDLIYIEETGHWWMCMALGFERVASPKWANEILQ